jgi:HAD superfamily phosphatase (TIGR01668 family)
MGWLRRLTPDAWVPDITALDAGLLHGRGFRALILDLDNTLAGWNKRAVTPAVRAWLHGAARAGLRLCIVSNNGPERVDAFARDVELPCVARAGKPRRVGYRRALDLLGSTPEETAVVGDQVLTDVLGARRMNMYAILVQPVARHEFFGTRSLRWLERAWVDHLKRNRGLGLPFAGGHGVGG